MVSKQGKAPKRSAPTKSASRQSAVAKTVLPKKLPRAKPAFIDPMKALLVDELPHGPEWVLK